MKRKVVCALLLFIFIFLLGQSVCVADGIPADASIIVPRACNHPSISVENRYVRTKYTPYNGIHHALSIYRDTFCEICGLTLNTSYSSHNEEHVWNDFAECSLCGESNRGR